MTFEASSRLSRDTTISAFYVRRYPPNAIWRGYSVALAISELEQAGNTVQQVGGSYRLNATEDADARLSLASRARCAALFLSWPMAILTSLTSTRARCAAAATLCAGEPVRATLIGIVQPPRGCCDALVHRPRDRRRPGRPRHRRAHQRAAFDSPRRAIDYARRSIADVLSSDPQGNIIYPEEARI